MRDRIWVLGFGAYDRKLSYVAALNIATGVANAKHCCPGFYYVVWNRLAHRHRQSSLGDSA